MSGSGLPTLLDQQHLKEARKKKVKQLLDFIDDKTVEWSAEDWDELDEVIDQMQSFMKKKSVFANPSNAMGRRTGQVRMPRHNTRPGDLNKDHNKFRIESKVNANTPGSQHKQTTEPMPPMPPLLKAFCRWMCSLGAPPPKRTGRKKRKHNETTGDQTNGHFRQNKKSKQELDTTGPPNHEINTTEPANSEINTTEPPNTEIDWSSIDLEAIANLSRK